MRIFFIFFPIQFSKEFLYRPLFDSSHVRSVIARFYVILLLSENTTKTELERSL